MLNQIIRPLTRVFWQFADLKNAMRELWITFILKLLLIAGYQVVNITLVLWFSSDFGLSDQKSLGLVVLWSTFLSIFTVLAGSLTDALGFRKTFFLGTGLCVVSRLVMVCATNFWVAIIAGLIPLAIGEALTGPVLVAAARTYSNTKQRAISFSLIYSIMNAGFLIGNWLFDDVRHALGEHGHFAIGGIELSTYRTLILVSMVIELLVFPFIFLIREGAQATDEGVRLAPRKAPEPAGKTASSAFTMIGRTARETVRNFAQLIGQSGFYRLLAFLLFIAFLKLIYRQLDYVFPKFCIRVLGDGAPAGKLNGLAEPTPPFAGAIAPLERALGQWVLLEHAHQTPVSHEHQRRPDIPAREDHFLLHRTLCRNSRSCLVRRLQPRGALP